MRKGETEPGSVLLEYTVSVAMKGCNMESLFQTLKTLRFVG